MTGMHRGDFAAAGLPAVLLAVLTLSACTAAREARLVELDPFVQIRYRCAHEVSGAAGTASTERLLDAAGRQVRARSDWIAFADGVEPPVGTWWLLARDGDTTGPRITASWFSESDADLRLDRGWLAIEQHIRDGGGRRPRPLALRLELRTNAEPMDWANGGFASPFEESAGPFLLRLDWSEAAALARGADRLFLLGYDQRQSVRARVEIDPALFARAAAEVEATIARTREMAADHLRECQYLEGGQEPEIEVT